MDRKAFPDAMPCKYTTSKDLSDRLDQTICRYGERLVWVRVQNDMDTDGNTSTVLQLYDWPETNKKFKRINPDDPEFDISLFDLGYFNYIYQGKNVVLYPYRMPNRKFKQGTSVNYVYTKSIDGKVSEYGSHSIQSQGFVDSVLGVYPQNMNSILNGVVSELALSPELAVRVDALGVQEFFWRTRKIAVRVPGQKVHKIDSEFGWVIDKVMGAYLE